jgi:small-conductance mechanosensitive channel
MLSMLQLGATAQVARFLGDVKMQQFIDFATLHAYAGKLWVWITGEVLVWATFVQLALVAAAWFVARLVAPRLRSGLLRLGRRLERQRSLLRILEALAEIALPLVWGILLWLVLLIAIRAGWSEHLLRTALSLVSAWIVIRLASSLARDRTLSRSIAVMAWCVAALSIVGWLDDAIALLDAQAISLGGLRVSALLVVKGVLSLAVMLWAAVHLAGYLERRINAVPNLTPTVQVLFSKLLKVVLITIAVVAALRSVGIDLTAFAVFSGAVGVGIGFGLQKAVSNLISGLMLLMDKSIKPGDVIAVGGTYGWVNSMGGRYVSVITRDGIEHLIPNEELITRSVENWSFSDRAVRLRIPIGISYRADVRLAMALCLEAAGEVPRVLASPQSNCLFKGFGESSLDLELRVWIDDPSHGVANVTSEVLLLIWDKFQANGIEIPYPQRDLHIRSSEPLPIRRQEVA